MWQDDHDRDCMMNSVECITACSIWIDFGFFVRCVRVPNHRYVPKRDSTTYHALLTFALPYFLTVSIDERETGYLHLYNSWWR